MIAMPQPPRVELTDREHDCLWWIVEVFARSRRGPTYAELASALGVSRQRTHVLVGSLRDHRLVEESPQRARRPLSPTPQGFARIQHIVVDQALTRGPNVWTGASEPPMIIMARDGQCPGRGVGPRSGPSP